MDPRHRLLLVSTLAAIGAVVAGWQIASGDYFPAVLAAGIIVILLLEFMGPLLPETALCALLVVGYVLGNRGFAQIAPLRWIPLPIGEIGLALAATLVFVRGALHRRVPLRLDALNFALLLWLAIGTARVLWDVRVHSFLALRDFATVYYCTFCFIAQAFAQRTEDGRRFHGLLLWAFALLPPIALLVESFPAFFLTQLTLGQVPIFYYKGDLLSTFLCGGFFLLAPPTGTPAGPVGWLRRILAVASLGYGLYLLSRAAMIGVGVGLVVCILARRWHTLRLAGFTLLLGLAVAIGDAAFAHVDFKQSKLYAAYEHFASIADISGLRVYQNVEAADSGSNNQFRTIWWRTIVRETLAQGPILGLGFGYDLAEGFIREFDPAMDHFTARSPHSIVVTAFGRLGVAGLAAWLTFMAVLARESLRLARRGGERSDANYDEILATHALCWVILVSACFGVVLEGPMGAIVFWILLGTALGRSTKPADPPASAHEHP